MTFHQEFLRERNGGEHANDFFGSNTFTIRIRHAPQRLAKLRVPGHLHGVENRSPISVGIQYVTSPFAPLLAQPNVYGRKRERRGFHDSTARISNQHIDLAQETSSRSQSRDWCRSFHALGER